ncbi:MAG: electron transfer flavoprotein subunit beta [Candidatus Margulisiibacteriota bacterium]|nr:MAG: electron transfer flavoprotein subunit beta [Candidatus Margulisbacteria bacterium GWF2_38_17]OGI09998.1 MAG: electron transfer flavoprotein subunit beta [Candidatus Margulisbacteria bacterium GWE2_39_32]PZM78253.1 MAG: electron transfer flavoprotein subunit beta [Candidatus Margulisiibacteriota bacterium]HCT84229.1 electron transfer flavoprotein subunit beta [Candidatus Margulisiibacteriota bacterium]HCY35528.1 electron transfer flavoprotein subunit beta [Candidatus Margulisiibacteriot
MDIIVCIKQVPDTSDVKINPETNTLMREGVPSITNPFDENAIEAALHLKEKVGGNVTVVSMGPPQVESALRDAIALGVDNTVLISDRAFAGADTWATSYTLAKGIETLGKYDLIIFGKQAIDGDTAQVGPGVAEFLNIPVVTYVRKIVEVKDNIITVERMFEDGYEVIDIKLPCAITVLKEINTIRMPSLKGKMKAKTAVIDKLSAQDINADLSLCGLNGSPTQVVKIFTPPPKGKREMLCGEISETVSCLCQKLKDLKAI